MFNVVQFSEILLPLAPLQIVLNGWMAQNVFAKLPRYSDGMHSRLCSALDIRGSVKLQQSQDLYKTTALS
jgi:hypothetical protein